MEFFQLDRLPPAALFHICQHLDNLKDIFSLQSTCKRIRQEINRFFWDRLRRFQLLASNKNSLIYLESGQKVYFPTSLKIIEIVCRRAKKLTEIDLSFNCRVNERFLMQVVKILRENVEIITSLYLSYFNPDLIYAGKPKHPRLSRFPRRVDIINYRNTAFPSLSFHRKICDLISQQNENIRLLDVTLDRTGFLIIEHNQEDEFHVEFNYENLTQNVTFMLHLFFSCYNASGTFCPRTFRLDLNLLEPDNTEQLMKAFIFCVRASFPSGHPSLSSLEEIYCRIPMLEAAKYFDLNELRADLRSTLKKIVWHVKDLNQATSAQTLVSKVHPPSQARTKIDNSPPKKLLPMPELPPTNELWQRLRCI